MKEFKKGKIKKKKTKSKNSVWGEGVDKKEGRRHHLYIIANGADQDVVKTLRKEHQIKENSRPQGKRDRGGTENLQITS